MSNTALATADPVIVADELVNDGTYGDYNIGDIRKSRTNRKRFNEAALQDLAANIKACGVIQPILIRPVTPTEDEPEQYELVAGERRWRASIIAGLATIPAMCRTLSDRQAAELQILENLQREDPHPLEEAEGFEQLMLEHGYSADTLADRVKKSRAYIYASLKLCALEPASREAFFAGRLTKSTALLVARIPVKNLQDKCVHEITSGHAGPLSTRDAAAHIERTYMLNLSKATFKPSDAALCPAAGSCTDCVKRAGNQPEIFTDVNANTCTDPGCFQDKMAAHVARIKRLAATNGQTVISGKEAKKIMPNSYVHSDLAGGYIRLDEKNYRDATNRTYRQILGKQAPPAILLESPHDDSVHEIVKLDDITDILKEKGVDLSHSNAQSAAECREREKAQEAQAKQERAYRTALFLQIHHGSLLANLVDSDLRLVASRMFRQLPSNTTPTKLVMSLYGWNDGTLSYPDYEGKLAAAINALSPAQLNQFIRDCALSHELHVNTYTRALDNDKPSCLLEAARRGKIDAKAIRAEVAANGKKKSDATKTLEQKVDEAALVDEARTQTEFRVALYSEMRDGGPGVELVRAAAKRMIQHFSPLPDDLLGARYAFDTSSEETTFAHIDQASLPEALQILLDAIFGELLGVEPWELKGNRAGADDELASLTDLARSIGISPDKVRRSLLPEAPPELPSDAALDRANWVTLGAFITDFPERIDELTKAIMIHPRGELTGMLERAATTLGYTYSEQRWHKGAALSPAADPDPDDSNDLASQLDEVARAPVPTAGNKSKRRK